VNAANRQRPKWRQPCAGRSGDGPVRERDFEWCGPVLIAKTAEARVTVAVLQINREERLALRRELMAAGLFWT
jgi:hypothetical protein